MQYIIIVKVNIKAIKIIKFTMDYLKAHQKVFFAQLFFTKKSWPPEAHTQSLADRRGSGDDVSFADRGSKKTYSKRH